MSKFHLEHRLQEGSILGAFIYQKSDFSQYQTGDTVAHSFDQFQKLTRREGKLDVTGI